MSKDSYRDRLVAYLDGELTQGERSELESHLKKCRECREELEALGSTLKLVRLDTPPRFAGVTGVTGGVTGVTGVTGVKWSVPAPSPPRPPRPPRRAQWWRWLWIPGLAAAAVLVVILGGDAMSRSGSTEKEGWVVVEGDSLSADEGVKLAMTLIRNDQTLKASLVKYDEEVPREIYNEIEDLSDEEEAALLSLLESKTHELERS